MPLLKKVSLVHSLGFSSLSPLLEVNVYTKVSSPISKWDKISKMNEIQMQIKDFMRIRHRSPHWVTFEKTLLVATKMIMSFILVLGVPAMVFYVLFSRNDTINLVVNGQ